MTARTMPTTFHATLGDALRSAQRGDGAFGPRVGSRPEPEPTAVAALALDDARARRWLAGRQSADGGFAATVRPSLAIVDGIVGMEGDGPIMGTPRTAGVIVVSTDPVAADATAARLMGIDGDRVGYLRDAGRFLGQARLERIEQRGEDVERSATPFALVDRFRDLALRS